MKRKGFICIALLLAFMATIIFLPTKTYAASSNLPQAKIKYLESYPWYENAKQSYKEYGLNPKYEYYDSKEGQHYIIRLNCGCYKAKGNVRYEFAFRIGKNGKWDKFSMGNDRAVFYTVVPRNKTVYVKARLFKEVNGKRQYGKWSKIVKESTHFKDIVSVSSYAKDKYVKGYIKGAFKGEKIKVKIGNKTYTTTVKRTAKKYPFKIKIGKHSPGQKMHVILSSAVGGENLNYTGNLWYAKKIEKGFTKKQVKWTWGAPDEIANACGSGKTYWYWDDGSSVTFKNGKVSSWKNTAK